ncbi:MAG: hypothetical protein KDD36_13985 [Flavobacteriales bacterium]|nr:hypothetical protein [Flavobacteriales bacterium]
MFKRISLALTLLPIFTVHTMGQNTMTAGIHLPHEIHLGADLIKTNKGFFGAYLAYRHPLSQSWYYENGLGDIYYPILRQWNQQSITLRPYYDVVHEDNSLKRHGFVMDLTLSRSNLYISDESRYAGSNTSYYAEFRENAMKVGVAYAREVPIHQSGLSFRMELGIMGQRILRKYEIEGAYSHQEETDRQEVRYRQGGIVRFGINYRWHLKQKDRSSNDTP